MIASIDAMQPYKCCPEGFRRRKMREGEVQDASKFYGLFCSEQDTIACDDIAYNVEMPQVLFMALVIEAFANNAQGGLLVNEHRTGNSCLQLSNKISYNVINTFRDPVQITHKDLVHRLVPHVADYLGECSVLAPVISYQVILKYLPMLEKKIIHVAFSPCIHDANKVFLDRNVFLESIRQLEIHTQEIEAKFRMLVPSGPHSLLQLCAIEVAKKLSDEKYHESIKRLPAELYEWVLHHAQ